MDAAFSISIRSSVRIFRRWSVRGTGCRSSRRLSASSSGGVVKKASQRESSENTGPVPLVPISTGLIPRFSRSLMKRVPSPSFGW